MVSESNLALSSTIFSQDKDLSISNRPNESVLTTPNASPNGGGFITRSVHFDPFSYPVLSELCSIWFNQYHPWFPILHQPSLTASLQHLDGSGTLNPYLTVKAICAVTLCHYESHLVSSEERKQWSDSLRDAVCTQALNQVSLHSVQALLIISNLEYGEGRFEQFWNLIALCKRYLLHSMDTNIVSNLPNLIQDVLPAWIRCTSQKTSRPFRGRCIGAAASSPPVNYHNRSRRENSGLLDV